MGRDHRQNCNGERDVGCGRNGPAADCPVAGVPREGDEDECGNHHSTDGGGDGQGGATRIAKVACDEFPFEFQTDDEEEDGQQTVRGPGGEAQIEVQPETVGPQCVLAQCIVGRRPR